MKQTLFFAGIALMLSSCATKQIHFDQLQDRNGLYYLVNDKEPFTGEVVSWSEGKVQFEGDVKNGLREGLWIFYYPSGQKKMEGMYKDGLKEGTWTYWAENGVQEQMEVFKLGNRLGNEQESEFDDEPTGETESAEDAEALMESAPATGSQSSGPGAGGSLGSGSASGGASTQPKEEEPFVNWDLLTGGPVKFYRGEPYTGKFVKYYREGNRGKYLEGYFRNGHRSGKWTYYERNGRVKDIRYY